MTVAHRQVPTGPGRLARRLIDDLVHGEIAFRLDRSQEPFASSTPEPQWACSKMHDLTLPRYRNSSWEHDLVLVPSQTQEEFPDGTSLVSCMCRRCRHHFVFKIDPGNLCGISADYPQHHFVLEDLDIVSPGDIMNDHENKMNPLRVHAFFRCSACTARLELEISAPRLPAEFLLLITDEERIEKSFDAAKNEDPERYKNLGDENRTHYAKTPLETLNKYLKDVLEGRGDRKISFRNKTFMVQFGESCEEVFRYLGFRTGFDESLGDNFWYPPHPRALEGKTPLKSERAFFEDVRSEVQSLLEEQDYGKPVVKRAETVPPRQLLERLLGVAHILPFYVRAGFTDDEDTEPCRILGTRPDSDDDTLKYAYVRQVHSDPEHKDVYVDALSKLAAKREPDLQMFTFSQQEDTSVMGPIETVIPYDSVPDEVNRAYAHFNLRRGGDEPQMYFINVYNTFREQSPAQKAEHRKALLLIARDRGSEMIAQKAYAADDMDFPEACALLGAQPDYDLEGMAVVAQLALEAPGADLELIILALQTVASHKDDPTRPKFENTFREIASLRQRTSGTGSAAENNTLQPATTVAVTQQPQGLQAVDMSQPAGLQNIRNTCYLNSILQYFYTVNFVRDFVTNLPANSDELVTVSNTPLPDKLSPQRAFVGCVFARELGTLFRELAASSDHAVKPQQRLANAALNRPEATRRQTETVAAVPNNSAPPLPPRVGENAEGTVSRRSSLTLVDNPDDGYEVVGHDTAGPATQTAQAGNKSVGFTLEELAAQINNVETTGSDQMDVEEVMGNVIDHLCAAFKVARAGDASGAPDPVTESIFFQVAENRKQPSETTWRSQTRTDRWLTAYPAASGPRDLYEALSVGFGLEILESGMLSFMTIETPPPNLHIYVLRNMNDWRRKNTNTVTVPETLYLDRYMHTTDFDSPLFKARLRAWSVKARLDELSGAEREPGDRHSSVSIIETAKDRIAEMADDGEDADGFTLIEEANLPADGNNATWIRGMFDSISDTIQSVSSNHSDAGELKLPSLDGEKSFVPDKSSTMSVAQVRMFWSDFAEAENREIRTLSEELDSIFGDMRSMPYRLHAIVCHVGSVNAGHYWVWIHDFEQKVWRKYNDTVVTTHSADEVFGEVNSSGQVAYLSYVSESRIAGLVSVPRRQPSSGAGAGAGDSGA